MRKAMYRLGMFTVRMADGVINLVLLSVILLLVAFSCYAIWDSDLIYQAADSSYYATYKPTVEDEGKSFQELQAINPEVFSWLTVYGTNIDYPVVQGASNMKYVNTSAEGYYSLSGAIFLDSGNSTDYSDFNNILYGHHMERKTMFGEIGLFAGETVFEKHRYGNLYHDGKDYGIEFFAFVHTDAYDDQVFAPAIQGRRMQQSYMDGLLGKSVHLRDVGAAAEDRLILLSTCSAASTNGRDILVGRITEETYADAFLVQPVAEMETRVYATVDEQVDRWEELPEWLLNPDWRLLAMSALLAAFILLNIVLHYREAHYRRELQKSMTEENFLGANLTDEENAGLKIETQPNICVLRDDDDLSCRVCERHVGESCLRGGC